MKKVGYNAFLGTNFGSVLQAFALYTQVKMLGFDCELLGAGWYLDRPFPQDIEKTKDPKEYDKKLMRLNFEKFIRNNFSISLQFYRFTQNKISTSKVLQKSIGTYDAFLCGSDQIWNPNQFWFKPENYLQFAERSKRVSYAPSIGYLTIPTELEHYIPSWKEWLGEIDYLSVRESSSADLIQNLINRKPEVVIDPTLLLTPGDWLASLKKPVFSEEIRKILDSDEPYMIAYLLDNHSIYENFVENLANKLNLKIVWLTGRDWTGPVTRNCAETDPSGFVYLFSNAKFACVDGFHGSCFSLNFSVPFLLLTKEKSIKNDSRMIDLYTRLGVSNRIVTDPLSDFEKYDDLNFDLIQEKLSGERVSSKKYLYESLLSASSSSNNTNADFQDEKKILSSGLNNLTLQIFNKNEDAKRGISLFVNKRLSTKLVKYSVYNSVSKGICTGCGACINICPRKALSFSVDKYGSYIPTIDISICDNCGICKRICPALNTLKRKNDSNPKLYAFVAKSPEYLKKSSSGGACGILSDLVIKDGGIVCGCAWNSERQRAEHIIVDNFTDVEKLHKSKYIQSYIGDVFLKIKEHLKADKKVLFIGCPCQVAGLKAFLRSDYDNLITIDILCGNAPSRDFLIEYFVEKFGEIPVTCDFRDKTKGQWNSYTTKLWMQNGTESYLDLKENLYLKAFHRHVLCPLHCEKCKYQTIPRYGDLSIGDFWGIGDKDHSINTTSGVSAILVNNDKGRYLLNGVAQEVISYMEEKPVEWLGGNGFALDGFNNWASVGRDVFYNNFLKYGFKKSFDIAIAAKKGEINDYCHGKCILHVKNSEVKFKYSTTAWEYHLIREIPFMFAISNSKGNYAVLPLIEKTKNENDYLFNIKFKIATDSNNMSFWIFDTKTKKMQCICVCKLNLSNQDDVISVCNKFTADWSYDCFLIGSSQITGKKAYISIMEICICEYNNYIEY